MYFANIDVFFENHFKGSSQIERQNYRTLLTALNITNSKYFMSFLSTIIKFDHNIFVLLKMYVFFKLKNPYSTYIN